MAIVLQVQFLDHPVYLSQAKLEFAKFQNWAVQCGNSSNEHQFWNEWLNSEIAHDLNCQANEAIGGGDLAQPFPFLLQIWETLICKTDLTIPQ